MSGDRVRLPALLAMVAYVCLTGGIAKGNSFTDTVNITQGFNVSLNASPCCLYSWAITPLAIDSSIIGPAATISSISITGAASVTGLLIGGFDIDILVGPSAFGLPAGGSVFVNSSSNPFSLSLSAPTDFHFAEGGLAGTSTTINGNYNFLTDTFTTPCCSVNNLKTAITSTMDLSSGLDVQALIYTGDPRTNIDLSSLQITVQGNVPSSVPEPSTFSFLCIGLLGLGLTRPVIRMWRFGTSLNLPAAFRG